MLLVAYMRCIHQTVEGPHAPLQDLLSWWLTALVVPTRKVQSSQSE